MAEPMHEQPLAEVFDDLVRCQLRLYNALDEALRAQHGIVVSQLLLLRYLREHSNVRAIDLAEHFAIGIGSTSKAVERHVTMGWIARVAHPSDRRSSFLELTDSGRRLVDDAEETFDRTFSELLAAHADPDFLATTASSLHLLRSSLEQHAVGRPVG